MAKLAIKGHATRGKEVIEILEMLGGKNDNRCCGGFINRIYLINENGYIESCDRMHHLDYLQLTLEEFFEKFPYKIGNKILYKTYGIYTKIKTMLWNVEKERVFYRLESNKLFVATADELQPRKEETTDKTNKAVFDYNAQCCDIMNHLIKEETMEEKIKIDIPKGYEFAGVDDDNQQVVFEKIGCQYPKTYEECCEVLELTNLELPTAFGYKSIEIESLQQLLVCRNAYWKIASEQMGLGKSWNQDYDNRCFIITNTKGNINTYEYHGNDNVILAFPTAEMRDAFKENFDDDIEFCKEFL